jgi:hypothetical protein
MTTLGIGLIVIGVAVERKELGRIKKISAAPPTSP